MFDSKQMVGFLVTRDRARARKFFVDILGFEWESEDDFALVVRTERNAIRIVTTTGFTPEPHTVLGWEVTGIEGVVAHLRERGVAFERYPGMAQDELGIWSAPGGTKVAWFRDPDGNVLSLSE